MHGVRPAGGTWVGMAGLDLVRDAAGELLVLEDNLRTPSGFAYAVEARARRAGARSTCPRSSPPRTLAGAARAARRGRCARPRPRASTSRTCVVLTDGPRQQRRVGARVGRPTQLGIPLVEPRRPRAARRRAAPRRPRRRRRLPRAPTPTRVDTEVGRLLVPAAARRHARARQRVRHRRRRRQARARATSRTMVRFHLGEEPLLRSVADVRPVRARAARARARRARDAGGQAAARPRRARRDRLPARRARGRRAHARAADRASPRTTSPSRPIEISLHPTVIDGELAAPARRPATLRVPARRRGGRGDAGRPDPGGLRGRGDGGQLDAERRCQGHVGAAMSRLGGLEPRRRRGAVDRRRRGGGHAPRPA